MFGLTNLSVGIGGSARRAAIARQSTSQTYSDAILADNPIAYWRLDEKSGTTTIDQTGNHDGTYEGSPALDQSPLIQSGRSVDFDGVDDASEVSDDPSFQFGTSDFSIVAWVRPEIIGSFHTIVHHRNQDDGNSPTGYLMGIRDTGVIEVFMNDGDNGAAAQSATTLTAGTVYFLVGRVNRSTDVAEIFIDGVSDATGDLSAVGDIATSVSLWIGRSGFEGGTAWNYAESVIDEVAIFDYALTEQQIQNHFSKGSGDVELADDFNAANQTLSGRVLPTQPNNLSYNWFSFTDGNTDLAINNNTALSTDNDNKSIGVQAISHDPIEAQIDFVSSLSTGWSKLILGCTDDRSSGYRVFLDNDTDTIQIDDESDGTTLSSVKAVSFSDLPKTLIASYQNGIMTAQFDGVQVSASVGNLPGINVGLQADGNNDVRLDNFVMRNYTTI